MNKDKDIRNFFKSSGKKEIESKHINISSNFVHIDVKPKEEIVINRTNEEKEKKGKKRKGAQFDKQNQDDGVEVVIENKNKMKKTNNKKEIEDKKIVQNPLPIEVEKIEPVKEIIVKDKRHSKNNKIIDDDMDVHVEVIQANYSHINIKDNSLNNKSQQSEINFKNSNAQNLKSHQVNKINENINKTEENKKLLKVDAFNFFNRSNNKADNKIEEKIIIDSNIINKLVEEVKEDMIIDCIDDHHNSKLLNMINDKDVPYQNNEVEDEMMIDLDDLDLEEIANDLFKSEVKNKEETQLKINKEDNVNRSVDSNIILAQRTIVPLINKINNITNIPTQILKENISLNENNNNIKLPTNKNSNNIANNLNKYNPVTKIEPSLNNILWTTKYAPKTSEDIIGNQQTVKKLMDWLSNWDDVVIKGNKREIDFSSISSNNTRGKNKIENINARACMISGPPGIGKTTTVRLIASKLNYRTYELNASDQRNKQIISNKVGYLMDNTTITHNNITEKNLIIMDEVDGMGGNEDKGGISALLEIVKKTKLPIICICNDLQNQKLRSLLNHCYELKFAKPDKRLIVRRLHEICTKENMSITQDSLDYVCESTGNDIRQCLNFLEMKSRSQKSLNTVEFKSDYNKYGKDEDIMINAFDSCKKMLSKPDFRRLKFREKMDLFFIDFDFIPNLIHENYLNCYSKDNRMLTDLKRISTSAECISLGDVIDKKIRTNSEWNLLPNRGICSSIIPAYLSGGFISYIKFPEIFGKVSKMRKVQRQLKEFKSLFPYYSLRTIKEEIAPILFSKIVNTLIESAKDGVEKVMQILSTYKINQLLFKENLFDLQTNETMLKKFEKLNPSVKSILTKRLNEEFKTSVIRRNKKEKISTQKLDDEGNVIEEDSGEDESDEYDISQVKVAKKTTKKAPTKKK